MTPSARSADRDALVVRDMRRWVDRAVIGLKLCPFAQGVQQRGLVHYEVSWAAEWSELSRDVVLALDELLAHAPEVRDTTLLVFPAGLSDFLEFNAFFVQAQKLIRRRALEGIVQLASFHPDYQFANAAPDDITNCTNRSPYPVLHLLREHSVARAVDKFPEAATIFQRNLDTMKQLGREGWTALGVGRSQPEPPAPSVISPRRGKMRP